MNKPSWQCVVPGCRNTQRFGDFCGGHAKAERLKRTPKEIRATVYPTGDTRTVEGLQQTEMTDGRQRWWACAREEAA